MMKRRLAYFFLAIVLFCMPSLLMQPKAERYLVWSDLPAYYTVAKMMTRGEPARVYRKADVFSEARQYFHLPEKREACFVAEAPYTMPLFSIFSICTPKTSRILCEAIGIVAMATALLVLAEFLELRTKGTLTLIALTALNAPFWESIRVHKPAPILVLALCCTLYFLKRNQKCGAALSTFLLLMKPHEFMSFFAVSFGAKQFKYLCWTAGIGILFVLCSVWFFGVEGWKNYFSLLASVSDRPHIVGIEIMPNVKGQLYRLSMDPALANTIANVCFVLTNVFMVWFGRRFTNKQDWLLAASASSLLGFAVCTHAHAYDLIVLIPAIAILMQRAKREGDQVLQSVLWLFVVSLCMPVYLPVHYLFTLTHPTAIHVHFILLSLAGVNALRFVSRLNRPNHSDEPIAATSEIRELQVVI